jgi:hypothetical protein
MVAPELDPPYMETYYVNGVGHCFTPHGKVRVERKSSHGHIPPVSTYFFANPDGRLEYMLSGSGYVSCQTPADFLTVYARDESSKIQVSRIIHCEQ